MKVLITGGGGQLARALVESAPSGLRAEVFGRAAFDLTSDEPMQRVIEQYRPDCIINAAAYTDVDGAESEPEAAHAVNADGALRLARTCAEGDVRLIHVSTDYVFGGDAVRRWQPDDAPQPLGVYGASKARGEAAIREHMPAATIVRTAWLYSRHGHNFVKTMLRLLAERDEVSVVDDQIGAPTWAANLARVLWQFALQPEAGIFHYTDAGVASWYDFAVAIAEEGSVLGLLAEPARVVPTDSTAFPRPAPRPACSVLDCRMTHARTGIAPMHWRVALRRMLGELEGDL